MKIDCYPYTLTFKGRFNSVDKNMVREGALLRTTFEDGLVGYSDCHPWVQLGDLPLREQLETLKSLQTTPLTKNSLAFAREDAEARKRGVSLFDGFDIPESYQLLHLDDAIESYLDEGISHFKLKAGNEPSKERDLQVKWSKRHPNVRIRLDFNQKMTRQQFFEYWNDLPSEAKSLIEYLEDPYPYHPKEWTDDQKHLNVPFAVDACAETAFDKPESARYLIYKPAKDHPKILNTVSVDVVVTSYLDHPVGQVCAAYTAAKLKKKRPTQVGLCGLLTHRCYENNAFIDELKVVNGSLQPPEGTGLGFDHLLENLSWQNVSSIG